MVNSQKQIIIIAMLIGLLMSTTFGCSSVNESGDNSAEGGRSVKYSSSVQNEPNIVIPLLDGWKEGSKEDKGDYDVDLLIVNKSNKEAPAIFCFTVPDNSELLSLQDVADDFEYSLESNSRVTVTKKNTETINGRDWFIAEFTKDSDIITYAATIEDVNNTAFVYLFMGICSNEKSLSDIREIIENIRFTVE